MFYVTAETPKPEGLLTEAEIDALYPQDKPQMPKPFTAENLKDAFGLTDEQAAATVALAEAMGLDMSRIRVTKGGTPGEGALPALGETERQPPRAGVAERYAPLHHAFAVGYRTRLRSSSISR